MRLETHDVDECDVFLRTVGWEVDQNQLSPGRYQALIDGILAPRAQVLVNRHARSFAGRGHTPKGAYTFGAPLAGKGKMAINQRAIDAHEVAAQLPFEQIEFKLPADTTFLTLSVDADHADRLADAMFGRSLGQLLRRDNAMPCDMTGAARLAGQVTEIARLGTPACHPAGPRIDDMMIDALLGALRSPEPIRGWSARRRIVRRAQDLILTDDPPHTVAELCLALAVPIRTLEDAFRHCLGVSPRSFIVAMRLNRVRRLLARPPAGTTVTEAAMRFGFFHLGRFSARYRRLFGELPSDTIHRAQGTRAP